MERARVFLGSRSGGLVTLFASHRKQNLNSRVCLELKYCGSIGTRLFSDGCANWEVRRFGLPRQYLPEWASYKAPFRASFEPSHFWGVLA